MRALILVVDDEPIIRLYLEKALGKHFDLVIKSDGTEALEWIRAGNLPEVVISDLNMPGVGGLELLAQLKSESTTSAIPVIFLSGIENHDEQNKCINLGAADYFVKPINIHQLIGRIQALTNPLS